MIFLKPAEKGKARIFSDYVKCADRIRKAINILLLLIRDLQMDKIHNGRCKEEYTMYLSFGEQVKIILKRKGMTIKELAEVMEERTGKKMSRQNLTQRLGRDNFQEKDMLIIAEILERPLQLNILDEEAMEDEAVIEKVRDKIARTKKKAEIKKRQKKENNFQEKEEKKMKEKASEGEAASEEEVKVSVKEGIEREADEAAKANEEPAAERISDDVQEAGDAVIPEEVQEEGAASEEVQGEIQEEPAPIKEEKAEPEASEKAAAKKEPAKKMFGWLTRRGKKQEAAKAEKVEKEEKVERPRVQERVESEIPQPSDYPQQYQVEYEEALEEVFAGAEQEDLEKGEMNPYTGREYESNSVRIHPKRLGYVQVYSRRIHGWTDMTEWAFLGEQERLKAELGSAYEEPIFLD